jgi:hypothetical protein
MKVLQTEIAQWIANTLPIVSANLATKVEQKVNCCNISMYRAGTVIRIDLKYHEVETGNDSQSI